MRLTYQQQGMIGQNEFAKFVMLGSNGEVELNPPLTDDDGRDFEAHRRRQFGRGLSIQVKNAMRLRIHGRARRLKLQVRLPKNRANGSPLLWYFFAHMNPKLMEFASPCFLIPSLVFHRLVSPRPRGHLVYYTFEASMSSSSRDMWSRYQVETRHIGRRLLQVLARIEKRERDLELLLAADQAAA